MSPRRRAPRLKEYERKRDFAVTPEPPPRPRKPRKAAALRFMVHKHDARRLHWDLRLELEGALASWAIPKGPSYDPAERRLAVQTEDHPLEYGDFEGRIPEGEYGAGDSIIWDRGTYRTEPPGREAAMREKGHLVVELDGEKLKGRWHLVRTRLAGGKQQWLCFKAKDEHARADYDVVAARPESVVSGRRVTRGPIRAAAARAAHPQPLDLLLKIWPPMKATLAEPDAAEGEGWLYEVKYDGFRAVAGLSAGRVSLQSRNGLDLSARFPEVAKALRRLEASEAVLDGEVIAVDQRGRASFQGLQGLGGATEEQFVVFDLLWLDGEDLRGRPLEERRDLLESVLAGAPGELRLAERLDDELPGALAAARRRGAEGVVAKRRGSVYRGVRSRDWLKVKLGANQELAIVGFTPLRGAAGAREIGALLVGVREGRGFRYAGKVGTGFTAKLRRDLYRLLEPDVAPAPTAIGAPRMKDARWVAPRHVAQVAFTEWTRDGKLRHPSFQGLRVDRAPEECVREEPVGA